MTKAEAKKLLIDVIGQLQLKRADYVKLETAIETLAAEPVLTPRPAQVEKARVLEPAPAN